MTTVDPMLDYLNVVDKCFGVYDADWSLHFGDKCKM